jgi:hypothetical protein
MGRKTFGPVRMDSGVTQQVNSLNFEPILLKGG